MQVRNKMFIYLRCFISFINNFKNSNFSNIADQCVAIIADNNLTDVIQVIKSKMEDVVLPIEYVDIIISEWMVINSNIILL
jgi:hypothetical protein